MGVGAIQGVKGNVATDKEALPSEYCTKQFQIQRTKALSSDELEPFRAQAASVGVDLSQGKVFKFEVSNDLVDRSREQITIPVLAEFANQFKQHRSLLMHHKEVLIVGAFFDAELVKEGDKTSLIAYALILNEMKIPGQDITIIKGLESGILKWMSLGFRCPGEWDDNLDVYKFVVNPNRYQTIVSEASIVYFGANPETSKKSAQHLNVRQKQSNTHNLKPNMSARTLYVDDMDIVLSITPENGIDAKGIDKVQKSFADLKAQLKEAEARASKAEDALNSVCEPLRATIKGMQVEMKQTVYDDDILGLLDFTKLVAVKGKIEKMYKASTVLNEAEGEPVAGGAQNNKGVESWV